VLDWAAQAGLLDDFDRAELAASLPQRRRKVFHSIDEQCESFPESLARTRLRAAGFRVRSQVPIEGTNERIDLLIEERIGLEVDGREFHAQTFEQDSAKSMRIALDGWIPLRYSANLVMYEWHNVLAAIQSVLGNSGVATAPVAPRRRMPPTTRGRRAATPEFPRVKRGRASRRQGNAAGPRALFPP
jgi:very-short-patch-repair endonuclease